MIDYNSLVALLKEKTAAETLMILRNIIEPELSYAYIKGRVDEHLNLPYDEKFVGDKK